MKFIIGTVLLLYCWIRRLLIALFHYLFSGFHHLLNMCCVLSSCFLISIWYPSPPFFRIAIISNSFTLHFADDQSPLLDTYGDLSYIAELHDEYAFWAALCSLSTYLKLIQYFAFSKKLSTLLSVISASKVNLFFFIMMFMLVRE